MKTKLSRQDRDTVPVILTVTYETQAEDGTLVSMRWIRGSGSDGCTSNVQKVSVCPLGSDLTLTIVYKIVLAYMSDFDL